MIDVIIPAYNAHESINRTLCSIAFQTVKDKINVYIVDDCSEKGYQENIDIFKDELKIKELKMPQNGGPGKARQYGIDNSTGDYIVFIDSDDVFFDCFALENLLDPMEKDKLDGVIGAILDEQETGRYIIENHDGCLHGKMYSRRYLKEHNIHFNETRSNEDNAFNRLFLLCGARVHITSNRIYVYHNNKNSITQKNASEYAFKSLESYAYNMNWVLEECERRNCNKEAVALHLYTNILYLYAQYCSFKNRKDSDDLLVWTKKLVKKYRDYEKYIDEETKTDYYYTRIASGCMDAIPQISFYDFLNQSENK